MKIITYLLIFVFLLTAVFFASCNTAGLPSEPGPGDEPVSEIEITGNYIDDTHIGLLGEFSVTGFGDMDIDDLFSRLEFDSGMEFSLSRKGEDRLSLRTFRPLEADKRIIIRLKGQDSGESREWEFQTESSFHIVSTFPADGAGNVPVGAGLEVALSYSDVKEENLDEFVSISPEAEGRVLKRGNMAVFIPSQSLSPMTAYTVTISGGLARENGESLGRDMSFSFTTGEEDSYEYRFSADESVVENAIPEEAALLKIGLGSELREQEITTAIYQYPDASGYRDALRSYRDFLVEKDYMSTGVREEWITDLSGLEQILEFTAPSVSVGYNWERFIAVPESLKPGWYAAKIYTTLPSGRVAEIHKLIQVSGISVYNVQSRNMGDENGEANRLIAWINDTETGKAVAGAEVSVTASNYNAKAVTDGDGLALIESVVRPLSRDSSAPIEAYLSGGASYAEVLGLLTVRDGDREFYDLYGKYYYNKPSPSNDYYAYLFTDRPVYRHTDTVKVWGVIRPRTEGGNIPADLRLTDSDGTGNIPVTPGEDGIFQVDYPLEAMRYNYAGLYLSDEQGNSYAYLSLQLKDYVKPAYQTSAATDKEIYAGWKDETVTVNFSAQYYEGTPAKGYNAHITGSSDTIYNDAMEFDPASLSTDGEGKASATLIPREQGHPGSDTWRPQTVYYGIYSEDALDTVQVQGGSFLYLPRDTILTLIPGEDGTSVRAETHLVDTSRAKSANELIGREEELLRGAAISRELTAEVHRTYFEKIPSGERYDPITKAAVTAYEYQYRDEVVATLTATTQNGSYTFANLPAEDEESSYYITVTALDGRGLKVDERVHYKQNPHYSPGAEHNYRLTKRKPGGQGPDDASYILDYYGYRFRDGESSHFYLTDNGKTVDTRKGRLLFNLSQDNIIDYGMADGVSFDLPFSEAHLPNYMLSGAFFDGKRVYPLSYTAMAFNSENRELNIEIEPGQNSYDPGDSASVTLLVTEKSTGTPAANTSVIAAMVDEAVFAVAEQYPNFLKSLYQATQFNFVHQYASTRESAMDMGGMGGGGPNSFNPRVDFPDTAAFTALVTDSQGKAILQTKLPDSLTSWRVTALAISPDLYAGDTKDNFTVSQDFFVAPVVPSTILAGDDLVITARGAGRLLSPSDTVEYSCWLEGAEEDYKSASGTAGSFTAVNFGKLEAGEYRITVAGEWGSGGKKDAVTLPLQVVESGVDISISQSLPLSEIGSLSSTSYPVTLGFYDGSYALGAEIMANFEGQSGARADQRIIRRYMAERMRDSGLDSNALDSDALSDEFTDLMADSLYRLFPYAEADANLSARIMLAAPDYYRGYPRYGLGEIQQISDPWSRAVEYLHLSYYNGQSDLTSAINQELEKNVYDFRGKMYLAAALARNGETAQAREWYEKLSDPVLNKQIDGFGAPVNSIRRSGGDNHEDTAAASLAATILVHPDAEGYARYLLSVPSGDELYILELLAYLNTLPAPKTQATVTFNREGEEETLDLSRGILYRSFSKRQLAEANFKPEGDVYVNASVTADYTTAMDADNRSLAVTKTVEPATGGTFRQGELVKITLRLQIPSDLLLDRSYLMEIKDYVPTGMRYDHMERSDNWYLTSQDSQRLTFSALTGKNDTVIYYARCVAPGNYVNESVFARISSASAWGASDRNLITINQPA